MRLEEATREYFLQCMKDPAILRRMRNAVFGISDNSSMDMQDTENDMDDDFKVLQKTDVEVLENKINTIIENQNSLENVIKELLVNEYDKLIAVLEEKKEKKMREEIAELELQYKEVRNKYEEAWQAFNDIKEENRILNDRIEDMKSSMAPFEKHIEMWNKLETLNEEKKEYIRQLCGGYSIEACMSLGRDERKIDQLWSFLRDEILKTDSDNNSKEVLGIYFEYCLEIANSTRTGRNLYHIYDIEEGSDFNNELCIRTSDSKQIGQIKKVLTRCVKADENIVYKAIVRVE